LSHSACLGVLRARAANGRGRRGVSTILGVLIFIGILFTAVIPMFLVMKQADTLYEQKKLEQERRDEERAMEDIEVYVSPESLQSPNVDVTIISRCAVLVHVVRIWVNDEYVSQNVSIPSLAEETLGPLELNPVEGKKYDIRVTTDRGNVFLSENGVLRYGEDGWDMEQFSIRIHTAGLFLRVTVWMGEFVIFDEMDFIGAGYEVIVPEPVDYRVRIAKWGSTVYDDNVTITWPIGDPWVDIWV